MNSYYNLYKICINSLYNLYKIKNNKNTPGVPTPILNITQSLFFLIYFYFEILHKKTIQNMRLYKFIWVA